MPSKSLLESTRGVLALLVAMTLFSTVEVASKCLGGGVPPLWLAFLRFFIAGLILLLPAVRSLQRRSEPLRPADAGLLLVLGVIGVTISIGLFHVAILYLKANTAAIVFSANPVFVAFFSPWLLGEKLTWRKGLAILLGTCGVAVFALHKGGLDARTATGLVLMLGSMIAFALYSVLSRKTMPRFGAPLILCAAGLLGSVLLLPCAWAMEGSAATALQSASWPGILYLGVAATALAYLAYFYGLVEVGVLRGSQFFFLKPVLASGFAWLILGETLGPRDVLGAVFILGALVLALFPDPRPVLPE